MTQQSCCTLCGAVGHTAAQCNWNTDKRPAFEAWVLREWPGAPLRFVRDALPKDDPRYGQYCDDRLQHCWVGFQAGAALAQPQAVDEKKMCDCNQGRLPCSCKGAQGEREAFERAYGETEGVYFVPGLEVYGCELREHREAAELKSSAWYWWKKARAALAQPSPVPVGNIELARTLFEEMALISDDEKCIHMLAGALVQPSLDERQAQFERNWHAQPSPEPGLERAEVVATVSGSRVAWIQPAAGEVPDRAALMTVAQHDRIVGALRAEVEKWKERCQYNANTAHDVAEERDAALSRLAELEQQEPITVEAVAITREDDDECLRLEWLLEGGIAALELPGTLLLVAHGAVTDDEGSGEVYARPVPAAQAGQVPAEARTKAMQLRVFLGKAGFADQALIAEELMDLLAAAPSQGGA